MLTYSNSKRHVTKLCKHNGQRDAAWITESSATTEKQPFDRMKFTRDYLRGSNATKSKLSTVERSTRHATNGRPRPSERRDATVERVTRMPENQFASIARVRIHPPKPTPRHSPALAGPQIFRQHRTRWRRFGDAQQRRHPHFGCKLSPATEARRLVLSMNIVCAMYALLGMSHSRKAGEACGLVSKNWIEINI